MRSFFKKNGMVLITLLVLLAALVGGSVYYFFFAAGDEAVKTAQVQRGDLVKTISATGSLSAVDNVDISSKITGRIIEVHVRENQHVNAGDILVRLDDTALKATLMEMEAKLDNARANYLRYEKLLADGAVSQYEYDSMYTDYLVAKTGYDKAASDVRDTVITTPIEGYVIGEPTPVGQTISSGISEPQVIMSVATLDNMQIKTMVDESDIGQVVQGQEAEFTVDAYPNEVFKGVVRLISSAAETTKYGVYYTVYVSVLDARGKLLPTMTARTEIIVDRARDVLKVPMNCLYSDGGHRYVKIYDAKKKTSRDLPVETGLSNDNEVAITAAGLQAGEQLVVRKTVATQTNNRRMGPPPM